MSSDLSPKGIQKHVDNLWVLDSVPPANSGRFGNAANGSIVGPPQSGWSLRLFKTFRIYERARLTVDGLFDNVLNHFIFGPPNVNISSASVGTVNGSGHQPLRHRGCGALHPAGSAAGILIGAPAL